MKSTRATNQPKSVKIIVRGLPPSLDEASMRQQLGELPNEPIYWRFCQGNPHLDYPSKPYLFIAFASEEDAINFADRFNSFVFVDSRGGSSSIIVELAPNVSIPKTERAMVSKDPEIGKVVDTKEFKQFQENMHDTVSRLSIDEQLKIIGEKRSKLIAGEITPLTKFVLQQHIQKRDRLEERRKAKEDERKAKKEKRKALREEEEKDVEGRVRGQKLLDFAKRDQKDNFETKAKLSVTSSHPTRDDYARKKELRPKPGPSNENNPRNTDNNRVKEFNQANRNKKTLNDSHATKDAEKKSADIEEKDVRASNRGGQAKASENTIDKGIPRERKPRVEREIYRPGRLRKVKEEAGASTAEKAE